MDDIFAELARSSFRRRFQLVGAELAYLRERGLEAVMQHARRFISERLAPADPPRDGRQTPMRGHPVFLAQHATATCCRSCLQRYHHIPARRALTDAQIRHVVGVIERWLRAQCQRSGGDTGAAPRQPSLFDLDYDAPTQRGDREC